MKKEKTEVLIEKYTVENLIIWRYKKGERELEIIKNRNILETKNCHTRKEFRRLFSTGEKIKTGADFGLCKKCRCHYSSMTKEYHKYEDFACREQKEQYADFF